MSVGFFNENVGATESFLLAPPSAVYNNLTKGTWAAWVYLFSLPAPPNKIATFVTKDPTNTQSILIGMQNLGGAGQVAIFGNFNAPDGSVLSTVFSNSVGTLITPGAWHHILWTFDSLTTPGSHIYIDGVSTDATATFSDNPSSPSNDSGGGYYIGNDTFDDGCDALIAEVGIWNKVLSGAEITAAAASTTGLSAIAAANLVAYWQLHGDTVNAPDSSGNGNTAVSNNALATGLIYRGEDSPGFTFPAITAPTLTVTASDNFTRANEEPLNPANWELGTNPGPAPLAVFSNRCVADAVNATGDEWWIGSVLPNDQFVSLTFDGTDIKEIDALVRSDISYSTGYDGYYYNGWIGSLPAVTPVLITQTTDGVPISPIYILPTQAQPGDVLTIAAVGTDIYQIWKGQVIAKNTSANTASGIPGLFVAYTASQIDTEVSLFQTGGASNPPSFSQGNSPLGRVIFSYDQYGNIRSELQTGTLA